MFTRGRLALIALLLSCGLLLAGPVAAFHFPWDQGHDTFRPNPPPPEEPECPDEDNRCETSHPVDIGAGDKIQRNVDFSLPGFGPQLALIRAYHSQDLTNGPFGVGWHSNLTSRLILTTDGVDRIAIVVQGDGRRKRFTRQADGRWARPPGSFQTLTVGADGSAALRDRDGTTQSFDRFGRLTRMADRNAQALTIGYDAQGVIATATAANGRALHFTKGADGRITTVTDPLGRVVRYTYDASGHLTVATDPVGGETRYSYDSKANLTSVIDARGNTALTLTYDSSDRVIREVLADGATWQFNYLSATQTRVTNPRNQQTLYTFNSTGQPVEIRDPLARITRNTWDADFNRLTTTNGRGHVTSFAYDASGNLTRETDALDQVTTFAYEPVFNQLISETDADGHETRFEYDARGNLTRIIDAADNAATLTYDAQGRLTGATDPRGQTTRYAFDAAGNLAEVTDAAGHRTQMAYDAVGNLTAVTDAEGRTTSFEYDALNRRTAIIDATNGETRFSYDANGNLTATTDPRGQTTRFAYDSRNRLTSTTNPLAQIEQRTYDGNDNLTSVRDLAGNTTTYAYDNADQRITETRPGNAQWRYEYDAAGNQTAVIDPTTVHTTRVFDALDRLSATVHPNGDRETQTYDARGNQTGLARTNTAGQVFYGESRVYDALSQTVALVAGMGQTTGLAYDGNGNLTTLTDPLGRVSDRAYDALDRISALTDAGGGITRYGYGPTGNLTAITDPAGLTTAYHYDALDRQTRLDSPDTGTTTADYDANGNLVNSTDARGITASHDYDALDRRIATHFPDPGEDRVYYYDQGTHGAGRLTGYDDDSGQTRLTWDARGNLLSETRTIGARSYTLTFAYDAADRLTALTYPSGRVVRYNYDGQGRVQTITANGASVLNNLVYLPFGPATTWIDGAGLAHQESFDADYRPTGISVGSVLQTGYLYDAADNLLDWTDALNAGNSQSFGYDLLDRLNDADGPYGAVRFSYDAIGNRQSQTLGSAQTVYSYAADSHRLQETTGADPGSFAYDAAGNLIQDQRYSYVYNQANRLAEIRQGGALIASYRYNAEGQRVAKTVAGQTQHFLYGPEGQLLGVYDAATGAVIEDLIYHDSVPVATIRAGVRYYIKTDHLGTPRLVTNQSGAVIWRWDSDPFGSSAPNQDPDGDGSAFVFNLRFPGQWFDAETDRHYNLFRDYDPALGRYVQSDPIGLAGGLSTYAYANGNPVRYADPEGLIAPAVWAAAVAYARCLAECAIIEAAVAAMVCPPSVTAVAANCAVDCLNPLNWLPGSKIFKAGKKARQVQQAVTTQKAADRARNAPKVRDAAARGRQAHREFAEKVAQKPGWASEPRLIDPKTGKTVIPDAVSPSGRPVELKPRTPSGARQGERQLPKYERATGKKGRVVYYDP